MSELILHEIDNVLNPETKASLVSLEGSSQTLQQKIDSLIVSGNPYVSCTMLSSSNTFSEQVNNIDNTIFVMTTNFDLNGETVTFGKNALLIVINGILSNGILKGNNTSIDSPLKPIFSGIEFSGAWSNLGTPEWFGNDDDNALYINRCIEAVASTNTNNVNRVVKLSLGKEYVTKSKINIPYKNTRKVSLDGNGACIVSSANTIIDVGYDRTADEARTGPSNAMSWIRNISLYGNGETTTQAIYVQKGFQNWHAEYVNIMHVKNGIMTGHNDSSDMHINACFIMCNDDGTDTNYGIYFSGPDNYVSNTRIYKAKIGINANGFVKITSTHVLCSYYANHSRFAGSCFLQCNSIALISGCYQDTQQYFVKGGTDISVTGCFLYSWNNGSQIAFSGCKNLICTDSIFTFAPNSVGTENISGNIILKDNNITNTANLSSTDNLLTGSYHGTSRPEVNEIGYMWFDTSLSKPIFWNGSTWVDATGTTV